MREEIFDKIYKHHLWGGDSKSGPGSGMPRTEAIRKWIPTLYDKYGIKSMLDIPCGDLYWLPSMELPEKYIGADVVPAIIEDNKRLHPNLDLRVLDLVSGTLPKVDLILARDVLGHLTVDEVNKALENIRQSGASYLLTTNFPYRTADIEDTPTGRWRPINMAAYGWHNPKDSILESIFNHEGHSIGKTLALYEVKQ